MKSAAVELPVPQVTQDQDTRDLALEKLQDLSDKNHNQVGLAC